MLSGILLPDWEHELDRRARRWAVRCGDVLPGRQRRAYAVRGAVRLPARFDHGYGVRRHCVPAGVLLRSGALACRDPLPRWYV